MEPDYKPWWTSKGIIGPIIAGLALLAGALFGLKIDAATQSLIIDQVIALITAVTTAFGILIGLYGRVVATKKIGPAPDNPQTNF
jgi:predicted lipid-binding transport protein (Tim44 family)